MFNSAQGGVFQVRNGIVYACSCGRIRKQTNWEMLKIDITQLIKVAQKFSYGIVLIKIERCPHCEDIAKQGDGDGHSNTPSANTATDTR